MLLMHWLNLKAQRTQFMIETPHLFCFAGAELNKQRDASIESHIQILISF